MKAVDIMRASPQSHQTPHTGRPQIIPVMSVRAVKTDADLDGAGRDPIGCFRWPNEVPQAAKQADSQRHIGSDHRRHVDEEHLGELALRFLGWGRDAERDAPHDQHRCSSYERSAHHDVILTWRCLRADPPPALQRWRGRGPSPPGGAARE